MFLKIISSYGIDFWETFGFNPFEGDMHGYLEEILGVFVFFSSLFAVSMIIYGAYVLMTSAGDPDNISKGQKIVVSAIIGLVLLGIAWLIINFAISTISDAL